MNPANPTTNRDPFMGYVASVILGLITSGWAAGLLVNQFGVFSDHLMPDIVQMNIAAGFFLGTVAANPVGALAANPGTLQLGFKFVAGFAAGVAVQVLIFTPFTAPGMSNYMFIILAAVAVPMGVMWDKARNILARRGFAPNARLARLIYGFLNWSDRAMFVFLMAASFVGFSVFFPSVSQVLFAILAVLSILVITIARRDAKCERAEDLAEEDYLNWLALEPEDPGADKKVRGFAKLKDIGFRLVPGAVLFGGVMWLALHIVSLNFPEPEIGLTDLAMSAKNLAVISAGAFAAVLVGLFVALGASLASLRLVALVQNWSHEHLREKYLNLVLQLNFRPIGPYWEKLPDGP